MTDLEIAKAELQEDNLTLAIVKNGRLLYSTKSNRINGFLDAIEKFDENLQGASLADRVAGKAIALLCAYAGIKEVYAAIMSRKAMIVFKHNRVVFHWGTLVENVLDSERAGICPFEKAAEPLSNPEEAYRVFKRLLASLKKCGS